MNKTAPSRPGTPPPPLQTRQNPVSTPSTPSSPTRQNTVASPTSAKSASPTTATSRATPPKSSKLDNDGFSGTTRNRSPSTTGTTQTSAVAGTEAEAPAKRPNDEVRDWYNARVRTIPANDAKLAAQGVPPEQRAKEAAKIRHDARMTARKMMLKPEEVADLQGRDMKKYGNPNGPTFDQLHKNNLQKIHPDTGKPMTPEQSYAAIIESSARTDKETNEKYGSKPPQSKL